MEVIIPCAGFSSRFPNMKPKYLLEDFKNKMMIQYVAEGNSKNNLSFVLLKEHVEKYNAKNILHDAIGRYINVVILDEVTRGPAETVYFALQELDFSKDFLIRDCDSFFTHTFQPGNFVYTCDILCLDKNVEKNSLGYVDLEEDIIKEIHEKKKVKKKVCVGGYQFSSRDLFIENYLKINPFSCKELFVSDVIDLCIQSGCVFYSKDVTNYINVGTIKLWNKFVNSKKVDFSLN